MNEFNRIVEQLKDIQEDIKFKKGLESEFKEKLKDIMRTKKLSKVATEHGKVTFSSSTVNRFQTKLFKESNPEMYEKFTKESVVERLTIK
jgi:predicted phage-related endonuclease